jgi:fatty-acyl-CoA synthase
MIRHPVHGLYDGLSFGAERTALIQGDQSLTYGQLVERVETCAADLIARGIKAGDRVGLCAANSIDHVVAHLAILRIGAVWTPLNPRNGAGLNAQFATRAKLALTLHDAASHDTLGHDGSHLLIDQWQPQTPAALPEINDAPDAEYALKFTGGSTGVPKGVVQSVRSAFAAFRSLSDVYGFTPDDVNLCVAPLTHGAIHYLLPVLAKGGCHVILSQPDRELILSVLKTQVTVAFMPPTLIYLLMEVADFGPEDFARLRSLTYSAAPMPPARIAQVIERFGPVLSTLYGLTEAPMAIASMRPDDMARPERRASVGRLFAQTPVALLTSDGQMIHGAGEGEILVSGDLAATHYLDAPDLNAAARHEAWLKTGDIGRLDDEGYLTLVGRSKEMIISGGYNIYPGEVEAALSAHPAVREVCAFGVDDVLWGERLEAVAVLDDPSVTSADLTHFVRKAIGPVRTPKTLHFLPFLPRNPVGKVVRAQVKSLIYPAVQ